MNKVELIKKLKGHREVFEFVQSVGKIYLDIMVEMCDESMYGYPFEEIYGDCKVDGDLLSVDYEKIVIGTDFDLVWVVDTEYGEVIGVFNWEMLFDVETVSNKLRAHIDSREKELVELRLNREYEEMKKYIEKYPEKAREFVADIKGGN